jgi:serine/threonine protein phosphatase 1
LKKNTEPPAPSFGDHVPPFLLRERPEGRVYVIGDIHGSLQPLKVLLKFLVKSEGLSQADQLVFVGDYIDRGLDSFSVVETLLELKADYPKTIFLRGNHEEMFLSFMGVGGDFGFAFLQNGGVQTLESYDIEVDGGLGDLSPQPIVEPERLPEAHLEFYLGLQRYLIMDDLVVVHAGLNPLRDLHYQRDEDIYWIREDFISNIHFFDKLIVFGHTPFQEITFDVPYKIGIDTGVVFGNKLTCVELTEGRVHQVLAGRKKVVSADFKEKGLQTAWSWPKLSPVG